MGDEESSKQFLFHLAIPQLAVVGIMKSSKAKFKIVKSDEVCKNKKYFIYEIV